jgi:ubiquinone/menaquinone biosynthesis C-methylase UbiE
MINTIAANGFQSASRAYERGRPEYPAESVELLVRELAIGPGRTIIDLGAGTGKFTRLLTPTSSNLIAIEPLVAMRERFREACPNIQVLDGRAEAIPLPDASVDAVVVAQAFHWFDGSAALAEIARVLKPKGKLGLIWHVRDNRVDWVSELATLTDEYQGNTPRYRTMEWRRAFEHTSRFSDLRSATFSYIHRCTIEMMLDRVASTSFVAALPEQEREVLLANVQRLLGGHPATHGRDIIEMPYLTNVFWCSRREQPESLLV